jgi:hypothetical protein
MNENLSISTKIKRKRTVWSYTHILWKCCSNLMFFLWVVSEEHINHQLPVNLKRHYSFIKKRKLHYNGVIWGSELLDADSVHIVAISCRYIMALSLVQCALILTTFSFWLIFPCLSARVQQYLFLLTVSYYTASRQFQLLLCYDLAISCSFSFPCNCIYRICWRGECQCHVSA